MSEIRVVDKSLMKRSNARLVFDQIFQHKLVSRPQLARLTGLSAMSTGRIADELVEAGLVREAEEPDEPAQGRPPKLLRVAREALLCLSVSLERGHVRIGAIDPYGTVVHSEILPRNLRSSDPVFEVPHLADALEAFLPMVRQPLLPVLGVTVPGLTDPAAGTVRYSAQFRWRDVPLAAQLGERFPNLTVVVDNDIKAIALAEKRFGVTQGYANSVLLSLGSGIGAAAVIGGEIYRGQDNSAGEIGHIVTGPGGRMCECGKIGCLQTNLADWAILQEAHSVQPEATLSDVFSEYQRGTPWAYALIDRVVQNACVAINLLVNTYAPGIVVLCGSLIERYPALWTLIEENYRTHLTDYTGSLLALKRSGFGEHSAMIGASALAFEHMLDEMIV